MEQASKKQVIEYGARTMDEIVEATLILICLRRNGICQFSWQSKGIYIFIRELTPEDVVGLNMAELKVFLQEQLRNAYDIKEIDQSIRSGLMREAERFLSFEIDVLWRDHLQSMDALRESVGLRGYGQKDPLIEYKNEGYDMFLEMMTNMRRNVIFSMFMFKPTGSPGSA